MLFNIVSLVPQLTNSGKNLPSVLDVISDIIVADNNVKQTENSSKTEDIQTGNISF